MKRRLSIAVLTVLVMLAVVVSTLYLAPGGRAFRNGASAVSRQDTAAATDSAAEARSRQEADTMCFASRIGLPCDPR